MVESGDGEHCMLQSTGRYRVIFCQVRHRLDEIHNILLHKVIISTEIYDILSNIEKQAVFMDFFPVFMNIRQQRCLVVGGGEVALRKTELLLKANADVLLVSPELHSELAEHVAQKNIQHHARNFEAADLLGCKLVISATNDAKINQTVSKLANDAGIPVNVVDAPELCSFIVPSIIDRSPVVVAVSSGGRSPVLARLLRAKLETMIPASYGRLAEFLDSYRDKVKAAFSSTLKRRRFWEIILQGSVTELMFSGREKQAKEVLETAIAKGDAAVEGPGEVYLVGAGPGDPDLLTFRALRLLQQADVVVYDRLVSAPILELARRDAEKIYVGKKNRDHTLPQEGINQLLIKLAKQGKRVLRLKGGDPFIFGRGGEEIETLLEDGITFQVVPGITAAVGCAAYAGIPLTHRDHAQSVVFATGHLKDNTINLNWPALAQPNQTVVFYMGLTGLTVICEQLMAHGMPEDTAIALIEKGTTVDQKVYTATLATLPDKVKNMTVKPPTLIIVGSVVTLHEKLAWYHPINSNVL